MATESDLERAIHAYDTAWAEAKRHGDDVLEALRMADLVSSESTKKLFTESAERSLSASENWRKAAELCLKIMGEIRQR